MSTLHGSWISHSGDGYFFLWGEAWRSIVSVNLSVTTEAKPDSDFSRHPFNVECTELVALAKSHNLGITQTRQTEFITLPSYKAAKGEVSPVLATTEIKPKDKLSLKTWQVEGFRFSPKETVKLLKSLPLGGFSTSDLSLGADLVFWAQMYRWSLDLLCRSKFLPGIAYQGEASVAKAYWQPLLDSTQEQGRLTKYTRLMPLACLAYEVGKKQQPQELILDFLSRLIDAQLRLGVQINVNQASGVVAKWLQSLGSDSPEFAAKSSEIERLETALRNWTLPIQDYLVNNLKLGQNQFRACFCLVPPKSEQTNASQGDWRLEYYLQALDDEDFLLDAATIWQNPVNELLWHHRTLYYPQETLLKGLGLGARLYEPIGASLEEKQPKYCFLNPIQVYEFIRTIAWQLQENGLGVILPPGLSRGAGEQRLGIKITAEVNQKKGERLSLKSLLNYKLDIAVGELTISKKEFEQLLAARSPIVEVNGQWIALQPADVRSAQNIFNQTNQDISLSVEEALRITSGSTKTLAKLPVVGFQASGVLEEFINNISNNQEIKLIETPKDFIGELRPYQIKGVSWLAFLEKWGLGACLADDMGLGKTIQLIAFILNLKAEKALIKPTLLICPTSVVSNWEREIKKFAPTLSVLIHQGDKRFQGKDFLRHIQKKDIVITSYSLVHRDEKTLSDIGWQGIVLDEAQNIKNPQAKQTQAVTKLKGGFKIALTGTPVENRLSDLWSISEFLNPSFLGDRAFFERRFAMPIEKHGDRESLQTLRSLIAPFILRRLKTDRDIIQDLPEKQEMNVYCALSQEQGELYQNVVAQSLSEIDSSEGIKRRGLILSLLIKLKQICNHPAQYQKEKTITSGKASGKLLRLEEMLEEVISEGDHALIFTQFAEWGKLLQPYLAKKLGKKVLFLYGGTRAAERMEMVDSFQNDPLGPPIFILSLKAGGVGLNLTRANHVFHIDRWWNPAVENQATDRAFRIGQKNNVQVHKFVARGTLEEKIADMIESKKQLAEQTVETGEEWLTELDTDQLRNLLLLERDAIIDQD